MNDPEVMNRPPALLNVSPTLDKGWVLVEEGFNLAREHEVESLFTVSNGYIGTRGSLAEGSTLSAPATFVAGLFDVSSQGSVPDLAVAPDWMRVRFSIEGSEVRLERGETLEHQRLLDLRQGILWREWRYQDREGRITRLRFMQLASLAEPHVLLQSILLTPENYSGRVGIEARVDPPLLWPGRAELTMRCRISPVDLEAGLVRMLQLRLYGRGGTIGFASASNLRTAEGQPIPPRLEHAGEEAGVEHLLLNAEMGKTYRLDRTIVVYTSRDLRDPGEAASKCLERVLRDGIAQVVARHTRAWSERWRQADVEIAGDDRAQRAIRFACYHLIGAANPRDEFISIGARALTGHAYKGHVFWDTEIFMLPFFIFTHPPSARALLMYRYHTLPAAREKARRFGYRGALYPWESADTGEETTPHYALRPDGQVFPILNGEQEHHIDADVAYGVWQYWQATNDTEFFLEAGAEILLETARFWASRGAMEEDGRYHIRRVIGPDEYHVGVDDNAYTNLMAQWNMERGMETARFLAERWPERWSELASRLALDEAELREWEDRAARMYTGQRADGVFEQFQGYFGLEDIDLGQFENRTLPIDVLLGRDRTQHSQVVKQADVVMLIYLLWDRFPPEVREANFRYYEPRTDHASSLSPAIHALVAARLGRADTARRYFRQGAEIDLSNNMGNAAGGVHAAALGGLWQAVVSGFAGMRLHPGGLHFEPSSVLPWRALRFSILWREQRLEVGVEAGTFNVHSRASGPVTVSVAGKAVTLAPEQRMRWAGDGNAWKEQQ